jgi:hypothetical protein
MAVQVHLERGVGKGNAAAGALRPLHVSHGTARAALRRRDGFGPHQRRVVRGCRHAPPPEPYPCQRQLRSEHAAAPCSAGSARSAPLGIRRATCCIVERLACVWMGALDMGRWSRALRGLLPGAAAADGSVGWVPLELGVGPSARKGHAVASASRRLICFSKFTRAFYCLYK